MKTGCDFKMGKEPNKPAVFSLIFAILAIASYFASTMLITYVDPAIPGYFVYFFSLFGLCGVLALVGLILGILGVRKPRLKVIAIISIIISCLVIIIVVYSGIMMIFSI